jgi:hypothetical protein
MQVLKAGSLGRVRSIRMFPNTAIDQFNAGKPWDVTKNAKIEGGHYILGLGRDAKGNFVVVTWGKIQLMTPRFYQKYCDEVVAYVSEEALTTSGKTLEGFDLAQLRADLNVLGWRQQAVLGRDRWDADALRDLVREHDYQIGGGVASCGVARQYTGSAGKITAVTACSRAPSC